MIKIIEITETKIIYLDFDAEKTIEFEECNQNWIAYKNRRNEKISEYDLKVIGQRDSQGVPLYIEFFVKPFVRFEFKDYTEYCKVRDKIVGYGWCTIDWS